MSRWLVFVDSKEKGKSLAKKLKGCAAYLDSEHKSGPVWDTLLDQEHFDAQVLICTAVLDCGCNVNESSLRNIVITTDDRTSFIQMLGRKRRTDKKTVRVWVHNISNQTISFRRRQCETWLSWYSRFDSCVTQSQRMKFAQDIWRSEDAALRKLFRLGNQNVFPNELARYSLARRFAFYDELLNGDTTFQEAVKQWLGHSSTNCDDSSDCLETFYQKHQNQTLFDAQQAELREMIVRMCKVAGIKEPQKRRCEVHQHGALNNRLKALGVPYEISLASEGGWHFRKFS